MGVNFSSASKFVGAHREMTTTMAAGAQEENENETKVDDLSDSDSDSESESDLDSDSDSDDAVVELTDSDKFRDAQMWLIRYIEAEDYDGVRNWLKSLPEHESVYIPFKTILHYIHMQDEHNFIRALIQLLSKTEHDRDHDHKPPLHRLARLGAPRLTALFLEHGADPNIKAPICSGRVRLELILPLCVALKSLSYHWISSRCAFISDNAAVRLVSSMCSASMMNKLETVRLLASKTKEIEMDQVICNYMRQGRVQELCVLMLLGYHTKVSSMMHFCCDESPSKKKIMKQLVDIFERIGDKLVYYLKLQGLKGVNDDKVILDVALLLNDAGYQLTSEDILPRQGNHDFFFNTPFLRRIRSGREHYAGVQNCSAVSVIQDFIWSYRHKNACSKSEAYKYVKSSYLLYNTVKPEIHSCPPFWFRVLWRATKFF